MGRDGEFIMFIEFKNTSYIYFPKTPFRIIINPRYVDLLYQQYLEAENLGFRYFTFILDFESRPERKLNKNTIIF